MTLFTRSHGAPLALLLLAGCNRHQSALHTFGEEASAIGTLTLVLVIGAVAIFLAMLLLMRAAVRAPEGRLTLKGGERLILWAGGIGPAVLLLALLAYSLPLMRPPPVARGDLAIQVQGEQFWWRVRYRPAGAAPVMAANEVRVPTGRTVQLRLTAGDVIHSFWIPGLAGKVDMIPGRENTLVVRATRPGRFRGQCTEFCGLSHALMAFDVVAMPPADFDAWLAAQARAAIAAPAPDANVPPARAADLPGAAAALVQQAATPATDRGRRLFAGYGCGGCHAIRGTDQAGTIGPDLTHFGSRPTLAAGILQPSEANIASFIRHPERTKPGVRMPAFPHMNDADARALARYLAALR